MGERILHMRIDVRGMLHGNNQDLKRHLKWVLKPDGSRHTVFSLREALMDALAGGYEFLPVGDECEGFDPRKGCPGHPAEMTRRAAP